MMNGKALIVLVTIALVKAAPNGHVIDPICATATFQNQLLPHEDSHKFYHCHNGTAVAQKCSAGLYFNFEKQVCRHPDFKTKHSQTHCKSKDCFVLATVECLADNSEGLRMPHVNCNQFYNCTHGRPVVQSCPAGKNYNPVKRVCVVARKVSCYGRMPPRTKDSNPDAPNAICARDEEQGRVLPHEDCRYFYRCNNGFSDVVKCLEGQQYNDLHKRCTKNVDPECGKSGERYTIRIIRSPDDPFAANYNWYYE